MVGKITAALSGYPTLTPIYAAISLCGIFGPERYHWAKRHILFQQMTQMHERSLRQLASHSGAKP